MCARLCAKYWEPRRGHCRAHRLVGQETLWVTESCLHGGCTAWDGGASQCLSKPQGQPGSQKPGDQRASLKWGGGRQLQGVTGLFVVAGKGWEERGRDHTRLPWNPGLLCASAAPQSSHPRGEGDASAQLWHSGPYSSGTRSSSSRALGTRSRGPLHLLWGLVGDLCPLMCGQSCIKGGRAGLLLFRSLS